MHSFYTYYSASGHNLKCHLKSHLVVIGGVDGWAIATGLAIIVSVGKRI